MEKKKYNPKDEEKENINPQYPDDSLKPVEPGEDDQPEIYKISRRGKPINRKDFIKSAAAISGLAAMGSLLSSCGEESELDIEKLGTRCSCHAVCTCDSVKPGYEREDESQYDYQYDQNLNCTCDYVCTCDTVCSCNTVCTCDSEGGGGGSTYWYPN